MKKELEYFYIDESYGGNQEWFQDHMMNIGGCGAVTACDCCIYLARHRGLKFLYPGDANHITRWDYLRFAGKMKPYLRPRKGGINTLEMFLEGFRGYLKNAESRSKGRAAVSFETVPGDLSCRRAAESVMKQIDDRLPVLCLTLHHSNPEMEDYVWHWFLLTGYENTEVSGAAGPETAECPTMKVKAVTYGEYQWIDFAALWDTGYEQKGGLILPRMTEDDRDGGTGKIL